MIGLCGGFTTFSSVSSQTLDLPRGGPIVRAPMNIASSVPPCVIAVAARHLLTAHFNGWKNKTAQVAIEEENLTREIPDPNCLARSCHFARSKW
jgi:hypothetical protein